MNITETIRCPELSALCAQVKTLSACGNFDQCCELIYKAMEEYPHAPQPHNLFGIILEKTGHHPSAMRHFRAAWALDPTYMPASQNLTTFGTFYSRGKIAFDEGDCSKAPQCRVEYDSHGIGRIVRRK